MGDVCGAQCSVLSARCEFRNCAIRGSGLGATTGTQHGHFIHWRMPRKHPQMLPQAPANGLHANSLVFADDRPREVEGPMATLNATHKEPTRDPQLMKNNC